MSHDLVLFAQMFDSLGLNQSKVPDVRLTLKDLDKLTAVKFRPKTSRFVKLADPKSTCARL